MKQRSLTSLQNNQHITPLKSHHRPSHWFKIQQKQLSFMKKQPKTTITQKITLSPISPRKKKLESNKSIIQQAGNSLIKSIQKYKKSGASNKIKGKKTQTIIKSQVSREPKLKNLIPPVPQPQINQQLFQQQTYWKLYMCKKIFKQRGYPKGKQPFQWDPISNLDKSNLSQFYQKAQLRNKKLHRINEQITKMNSSIEDKKMSINYHFKKRNKINIKQRLNKIFQNKQQFINTCNNFNRYLLKRDYNPFANFQEDKINNWKI